MGVSLLILGIADYPTAQEVNIISGIVWESISFIKQVPASNFNSGLISTRKSRICTHTKSSMTELRSPRLTQNIRLLPTKAAFRLVFGKIRKGYLREVAERFG